MEFSVGLQIDANDRVSPLWRPGQSERGTSQPRDGQQDSESEDVFVSQASTRNVSGARAGCGRAWCCTRVLAANPYPRDRSSLPNGFDSPYLNFIISFFVRVVEKPACARKATPRGQARPPTHSHRCLLRRVFTPQGLLSFDSKRAIGPVLRAVPSGGSSTGIPDQGVVENLPPSGNGRVFLLPAPSSAWR